MTDLKSATSRLAEAVGTLDAALARERAAAAETAAALMEAKANSAAATSRAEALEAELGTVRSGAEASHSGAAQKIAELEAALADAHAAPAPEASGGDPAEIDALKSRIAELEDGVAAAEKARDAARADIADMKAERDAALEEIGTLKSARTDDARLRAEAADALDAAIGELKVLSGAKSHG